MNARSQWYNALDVNNRTPSTRSHALEVEARPQRHEQLYTKHKTMSISLGSLGT